ncbi:fucosyl transferase [Ancylostoma ceylanicum]|uniref:Fucosyltransferase n=1 Tax=Ancylostoma ceylanicum TaxID=53326 RepID=A0A0D6LSN2_9BILA|nr:fucosyl transferase [Ancylostoma ceylanicum]
MRTNTIEQALTLRGQHGSPLKLATAVMLVLAAVSTTFVFYQDAQNFNNAPRTIPLIVAWTRYFSHTLKEPLLGTLKNCRYQCEFIDRREQALYNRSASAYVMHGRDLNVSDLPKTGPEHMNVLFLLESPHHSGSAIYRVLTAVRRKKRGSLIFVSNCHTSSKREDIISGSHFEKTTSFRSDTNDVVVYKKNMKKDRSSPMIIHERKENKLHKIKLGRFTEVTVRGGCEKQLLVDKSLASSSCKSECSDNELIANHRFYIAFENSICNDYITEKFFMRASQMLVPVVMRRRYYERAGIPPRAFIALDDFRNVKEMGQYLNYLRNNDTEYMKYFEWTAHFRKPSMYHSNALCKLCEDIYNGKKIVNMYAYGKRIKEALFKWQKRTTE